MSSQIDEQQLRLKISQKLVETGEKENLKEYLRLKLVESGWRDQLKQHCKEVIKTKESTSGNVTVEELVAEVTPFARSTVPEVIKAEIYEKVKKFIDVNFDE